MQYMVRIPMLMLKKKLIISFQGKSFWRIILINSILIVCYAGLDPASFFITRNVEFKKLTLIFFGLIFFFLPNSYSQEKNLLTGADILIKDYLDLLKGKRIGLVTNHTAILKNGTHLVDTLSSIKDMNLTALFGPEHGIRGIAEAGKEIKNDVDLKTGIPVYSLYGKNKKPVKEILQDVDLILYDIQDVGVRFYTYISTMFYVLQAAAENKIPVIVLDRPNPIDGVTIEGPLLKEELKSFVGIAALPVRYGMTPGELANFFSGENYLEENLKPDLTIIELQGWERDGYFNDYDVKWIPTSPNIPDFESALVYPGTCLLEGTNISEGRGTKNPFITIGAPFVNSAELIEEMNRYGLEGVKLKAISFTPDKIPGAAENPKYENQLCNGIFIEITDKRKFKGFEFGIKLLSCLIKLYPESIRFNSYFDKLAGDKTLRELLLKSVQVEEIIFGWRKETEHFKSVRKKYLLY